MKPLMKTIACFATLSLLVGCETKEKVIDIKTPAGGVEVQKSGDGVEIDIKSSNSDGSAIRIDVPGNTAKDKE